MQLLNEVKVDSIATITGVTIGSHSEPYLNSLRAYFLLGINVGELPQ
jgi:hypothetical protein